MSKYNLVNIRKNSIDEKNSIKTLSDTKIGVIGKVGNSKLTTKSAHYQI